MQDFLLSQLDGQSGEGVTDLCLDHKLIDEFRPDKFEQLAGLELFPDLKILSIAMHLLRNLNGLPPFPKLIDLDLNLNEIEEISEVEHLPHLQFLHLQHNEIRDLGNIRFPKSLIELNLSFNHFEDKFQMEALPQLKVLLLNGNRRIRELGPLPSQLAELQLRQCFIKDFTPIGKLQHLKKLGISPGSQSDLSCLSDQPKLELLCITGHRLSAHFDVPSLPQLQHLQIIQAKDLQFVAGIKALRNLKQLEISNTLLSQLPDLSGLEMLNTLKLKASPINSLKGLEELKGLKNIYLQDTLVAGEALKAFQQERPEVEIHFA